MTAAGRFCSRCGTAPAPGALYCPRCGSQVAEPERAPSGLPSRSVGSLGAAAPPAPPMTSSGPSWDLPTPVIDRPGPEVRRRRPSGVLRVILEILVIVPLTVLAAYLLEPVWTEAAVTGDADLWPVPSGVWWAAAVPVLGIAIAVLIRRTGHATPTAPGAPTTAGPSWPAAASSPAAFTPAATPAPAFQASAPLVEVPQSWLPPRADVPTPAPAVAGPPQASIERTQVRSPGSAVAGVPSVPTGSWAARLDDGTEIDLSSAVILGRDPARAAGEPPARLIPVTDPSISKTHLRLDPDGDRVLVVDRWSTNGVEILGRDGSVLECVPGAPTPVPEGGTVRFGDRALVLQRS